MTKKQRISLMQDAQYHLRIAIEKIRQAVKGTEKERYCERYIIGHLKNWKDGEGGLDITCPKLIDYFQNDEEF